VILPVCSKNIGVSNFSIKTYVPSLLVPWIFKNISVARLEPVLKTAKVVPAVNQIE
jgi:diketogulonate reductase-like aldo/keto reductase